MKMKNEQTEVFDAVILRKDGIKGLTPQEITKMLSMMRMEKDSQVYTVAKILDECMVMGFIMKDADNRIASDTSFEEIIETIAKKQYDMDDYSQEIFNIHVKDDKEEFFPFQLYYSWKLPS